MDELRTFETAARLGSFAQAAVELSLTPSAVSHQLRRLERQLGFELFVREGRSVRLSASGGSFLKSVRPAIQSIDAAAARLRDHDGARGPLTVACSAMFANQVLSHALGTFAESFPFIECTIVSMENEAVLLHETSDIGVLFGSGDWAGRWTMLLGAVRYSPVCSPQLFPGPPQIPTDPADLMRHLTIHIDDGTEWRRWNEAAGIPATRQPQKQVFTNDVGFALEMAAKGGGVTLASGLLAASYLQTGALIRPFPVSIDVRGGWYVVATRETIRVARVQLFVRWLAQQLGLETPQFV
jgi:LysR family glycine cleavage system transcriptional activator